MRKRRGRGEGGIRERTLANGTKKWVAELRLPNGKRKCFYGDTKAQAMTKMQEERNKLAIGITGEALDLSLADWLNRWLDQVKPTVEPNTYIPYARHCRTHLIPHVGHIKLGKFKAIHVQHLYTELAKAGMSAAMQRKVGTTLTIALNAAIRLDLITGNPAEKVRKPKAQKPEMTPLDPDQVRTFLTAAQSDRLYAFYATALDTGARPGELFALTWDDIDLEGCAIAITKSLEDIAGKLRIKPPKTGKGRRIDISQHTALVLSKHRAAMAAAGFSKGPVFCNTEGNFLRISDLHKQSFQPLLKRTNLSIRLYDLRHTCATLLLLAGVQPKVVSERLGHASITITCDTYAHVLPTMQQNAAKLLGDILNGGKMAVTRVQSTRQI